MFFVLGFILAAASPSMARVEAPKFACSIHQDDVDRVDFGRGPAPAGFTRVTVVWSRRAPTSYLVRDDANAWFDGGSRGFVLALQKPDGRALRLGVRPHPAGGLLGLYEGGDGNPFPVACAKF